MYEQIRRITLSKQTTRLSALQAFLLGSAARATADIMCVCARVCACVRDSIGRDAVPAVCDVRVCVSVGWLAVTRARSVGGCGEGGGGVKSMRVDVLVGAISGSMYMHERIGVEQVWGSLS
jgi:hypothetical protein